MRLKQVFRVDHPIDPVWTALTDLTVVAECLPGAAVTSIDGGVHHGNLTVRLGSIRAAFAGTAELTKVDRAGRTVSLTAAGGGTQGHIRVLIDGVAVAVSPAATEIRVDTTVEMSGRIAQLGHGAAGLVTERMIQQLTQNLDRRLSGAPAAAESEALAALSFMPALAKGALAVRRVRLALTALAGFGAGVCYARWRRP
ncbi:SRPBCC domain-containing protein [Actinophytocola sp.]|uniref:SRPBCC domain-containing protein n=1 Tax=Actinophytocola sp. TaxID=1872138 RepID=UPI003D6B5623